MLPLLLLVASQAPPPAIAIEARLARELSVSVDDTVRVRAEAGQAGRLVRIGAIYEARSDPVTVLRNEYRVRFHLPELASLLGSPDRVDRIGVALAPGTSPDSAAELLDAPGAGFRARPSADIASSSSRTFLVVSRFHRAIGVISIVASAIFLLCIMLLKVEERRLDAAMMRMIGIGRRTVFSALLLEACLVALVGAAIGAGLSVAATAVINAYYGQRFETWLRFAMLSPELIGFGVLLSLGLGVAAGTIAAARLVRTQPLALWRRG